MHKFPTREAYKCMNRREKELLKTQPKGHFQLASQAERWYK